MEDDSFRQESPTYTSKQFFSPEFDTNKFSSFKSFLDSFDQNCVEYQNDEQWKKKNLPRYLTGSYLKFWYDNKLFNKTYQENRELLITVFDMTRQEKIQKFHNLKLKENKNLISFFTKKLAPGKKLNYDDSSIVERMTLSSPMEFQIFLIIQKISTPCQWIATMRLLIAVTPDSSNRNAGESGSSRRWSNQAYGNINTGTDPLRFKSRERERGYRQPHQSQEWCVSMKGNSSTVNLGSLYNKFNIIFARPEIVKMSKDIDDNYSSNQRYVPSTFLL
ncbi:hypothetical protein TNCT_67911 [Trichonephila clavata]|uniref:Uncharacterized protein n=1 Tax=Trichonephila clavata TaxID=2740835 RepID=A0A8X6HK42_TRICU|nr:hypothetical protein TNCT_67911 [Trichonephila clavata]